MDRRDLVIRIDTRVVRPLVAVVLFGTIALVASTLHAGSVTKPHTFTNATVADATQVNANFDTLYAAVNDGDSARPFLTAKSTTNPVNYTATTFTGVGSVITLSQMDASGITLSGDDLTFTKGGQYFFSFSTNWWSRTQHLSLRLRKKNGDLSTLILRSTYSSTDTITTVAGAAPAELQGVISVNAGDVAEIQYALSSGTASSWGGGAVDGETPVTARLDVFRIR